MMGLYRRLCVRENEMRKRWGDATTGPDWMDVIAAMQAVGAIHLGLTMVTILPLGTGVSGGMRIAISTHWDALPGSAQVEEVITERSFSPEKDGDLPAFVLGGIYAHDYAISEAYRQKEIPQ